MARSKSCTGLTVFLIVWSLLTFLTALTSIISNVIGVLAQEDYSRELSILLFSGGPKELTFIIWTISMGAAIKC